MAFILTTTPAGGSSGSNPGSNPIGGIILANSSLTLDSIDTTNINTVKWFLELIDNTNQNITSFEVYATHSFGDISNNKTNILGNNISYTLNVIMNGTNINLNIANNESVNLNYKFVRITL